MSPYYTSKISNSFQQVAEAQCRRKCEYILMTHNEYEEKQNVLDKDPDALEK